MRTKTVTSRSLAVGFLVFSAALFFSSLFLVNCSTKENARKIDPVETQAQIAFEDLSAKLDVLNREFLATHPSVNKTRGPGWRIFWADVAGALAGSLGFFVNPVVGGISTVLLGAAASDIQRLLEEENKILIKIDTYDYYIDRVFEPTEFDAIGNLHNALLQNITAEYGSDFFTKVDISTYYNTLLAEIGELEYDLTEFNRHKGEYKLFLEEMINILKTGDNESMYALILKHNPGMTQEVEIIKSYLETYDAIDSDQILDYSVLFRDLITKSSISAESKQVLQSTVSVGAATNALWRVEK